MRIVCRLLLLLSLLVAIAFAFGGWSLSSAFAAATTPNKLEIVRSPGLNTSSTVSHEVVLSVNLIQQLYQHTLSLPTAAADQLCPMYLIANYQLTFFHNSTSILHVNAVNGECQSVALSKGDVRTADSTFWKLLNQAQTSSVAQNSEPKLFVSAIVSAIKEQVSPMIKRAP
jgi:hypothetical protein